ncbi:ATP-dependent RNA helicase RhlE [Desulfocicer vacuolatum DSM 3385]|uniref:DEAD-box ATP-dependent RNA helicase RhpA n=1 Tax=Desulfocicer vacuolatum DSM 3385 TaxID=1121400 RepID=A0A1W2AGS2_9BACT|nr:DEAD/DEAH box helicase [Desulfocicer vacuolatum]SMC59823.1 ATP-dependent RNA helicase RhlE [Desulfocicer vacuolatum DSM 3385]
MSFEDLGLRVELLKAVKTNGYTAPTPIQSRVIPSIIKGRDVLARAQTGTGKTDAFALPLVHMLSRQKSNARHPRALILAPTRELALQVGDCFKDYARRVSLRCSVVYGGVNINPQIHRLRRGIDILVATPGRLLDLASHRDLHLSQIEFLVFDEADRMLDLGFSGEISAILELMPTNRQTMLFSATYTPQVRQLAHEMLNDPKKIEVSPNIKAAASISQRVHLVEQVNKCALLVHLMGKGNWSQVLVFTRTKHGANKLTEKLMAKGVSAAALHGNMSQSQRTRTLKEFKKGEIRTLVATDVAARGLDISNLPHVVNYDMPRAPEDYIHRIGRTGRAGVSGLAVSLVNHDENASLKAIEKLLKQKIPKKSVEGYTVDGAVPEFVLLRPKNPFSEKKASKGIKEVVSKRNASKTSAAKPAGAGKGGKPDSKSSSGKKAKKFEKKLSRSQARSRPIARKGKNRKK